MKEYTVLIEETFAREITIEANSRDEAHEKVSNDWENEHIILDSGDFQGVYIAVQD